MAETALDARPLSGEEKRVLQELLRRNEVTGTPAVRIGDPYVALVNLSLPNRADPEHGASLVRAGETVYLTQEEAAKYLRHGPGTGRQIPVIKAKAEMPAGAGVPRIPPRAVSGQLQAPPPPAPGTDGPRPDPAGSSAIQVMQPAEVPESAEPQAGSENSAMDAVDIVPPATRRRAASVPSRG